MTLLTLEDSVPLDQAIIDITEYLSVTETKLLSDEHPPPPKI
jgi:hypothetical protein